MQTNGSSYFQIAANRQDYLGERYFKFDQRSDSVVQVVAVIGEPKKGRANALGVYLISRLTFLSNYFAQGYAIPCTKEKFDKIFDKTVEMIKQK